MGGQDLPRGIISQDMNSDRKCGYQSDTCGVRRGLVLRENYTRRYNTGRTDAHPSANKSADETSRLMGCSY